MLGLYRFWCRDHALQRPRKSPGTSLKRRLVLAPSGDRSQLTYLYGLNEFASLDDWPSRMDVLTTAYGEEEAARLSAALESLTKTKTSLWALESELSQLSGKE